MGKKIPFVPMSGFKGDNLIEESTNMPWYSGFTVKPKKKEVSGKTLLNALNDVVHVPKRPTKKPLRMPVSGVYKIKGVGDVITGRVEQGTLKPGPNVVFAPTGVSGKWFSIEMHHKTVDKAGPGDNVGVNVKGLPKENMPKVGDVMSVEGADGDDDPPKAADTFRAAVFVQDHPGQLKSASADGKGGFTPSIHVRTAKAPCQRCHFASMPTMCASLWAEWLLWTPTPSLCLVEFWKPPRRRIDLRLLATSPSRNPFFILEDQSYHVYRLRRVYEGPALNFPPFFISFGVMNASFL